MLSDFYVYRLKIKIKFIRIRLLYIRLRLKPVKISVSVLTGLDQFFGSFLNFKISKRPRPLCLGPRKDQDRGPVFIQFSPVRSPVFYRSLRLDLETLFPKVAKVVTNESHIQLQQTLGVLQ